LFSVVTVNCLLSKYIGKPTIKINLASQTAKITIKKDMVNILRILYCALLPVLSPLDTRYKGKEIRTRNSSKKITAKTSRIDFGARETKTSLFLL
jgi:hypothetical protein